MHAAPVVTTPIAPVQHEDEEFVTFTGVRALYEEDLTFHEVTDQDDGVNLARSIGHRHK